MFGGLKRGIITLKANDPFLSNLISEEKDTIAAIKQTHQSNAQAAKYLTLWGEQEHADLKDITAHYNTMTNEFTMMMAEWEYAQHEFREKLKDIRTHSDTIATIRSKSKSAADKLLKAQKSGKPTEELSIESRALEAQLNNEIAAFESTKRSYLQQGMLVHFNGLKKFAMKLNEFATFGAELAHQIPQFSVIPGQQLPIYGGSKLTEQIVSDFQNAVFTIKDPQLAFAPSRYGKKPTGELENFHPFSTATDLAAKPDVDLQDTEQVWEANFDEQEGTKKASGEKPPSSQFQELSLSAADPAAPVKPPRNSNFNSSEATLPSALNENPW